MSFQVHGDRVNGVLHAKVLDLAVVVGVFLVKNRDRSAWSMAEVLSMTAPH